MPNTIEIMVRSESGSIGENLGLNFSISADVGVVVPDTVTKNELISGKILIVDELASNIVLTSLDGTCANTLSINIDKEASTCYSVSASSFQVGNTRPLSTDGTIAAFNTGTFQASDLNNLFTAQDGTQFNLNIFGKIITFLIETTSDNDDGSYFKIGTATENTLGSGEFSALFLSAEEVDMDVIFSEASVGYTIKGNLNSDFSVEEWSFHDLISTGF
jgi:hypothetical protein